MCCVILRLFVFCLSVDLIRLPVPVQMIDWKNSSPNSEMTCNVLMGTLIPTHSLTQSINQSQDESGIRSIHKVAGLARSILISQTVNISLQSGCVPAAIKYCSSGFYRAPACDACRCRARYCFINSIRLSVECRYCVKMNGHIVTTF